MSSPDTPPPTAEDARSHAGHARRATVSKALVWLGLIAVAVFPFPWWW